MLNQIARRRSQGWSRSACGGARLASALRRRTRRHRTGTRNARLSSKLRRVSQLRILLLPIYVCFERTSGIVGAGGDPCRTALSPCRRTQRVPFFVICFRASFCFSYVVVVDDFYIFVVSDDGAKRRSRRNTGKSFVRCSEQSFLQSIGLFYSLVSRVVRKASTSATLASSWTLPSFASSSRCSIRRLRSSFERLRFGSLFDECFAVSSSCVVCLFSFAADASVDRGERQRRARVARRVATRASGTSIGSMTFGSSLTVSTFFRC